MRRTIEIPDETIRFQRTERDAGLQCDLTVVAYDGGLWTINGKRIGTGLDVAYLLAATLKSMEQEQQQ